MIVVGAREGDGGGRGGRRDDVGRGRRRKRWESNGDGEGYIYSLGNRRIMRRLLSALYALRTNNFLQDVL
jgi:hypothetical protein